MVELMRCPACGSKYWTSVYQGEVRDGAPGRYVERTVYRCACGLEYLEGAMTLDDYASGRYREKCPEPENAHEDLIPERLRALGPVSGLKVLDVGAGNMLLTRYVLGVAESVTVVEPAHGHGWPEKGRRFDIATAFDVIEHVGDPLDLLADMRKRADRVLISTPDAEHPGSDRRDWYRTQHRWYFHEADLRATMARAHLKDVRVSRMPRERGVWLYAEGRIG